VNPAASAVAFFALGVTVFGAALLLLFNPRSAEARWFAAFDAAIAVWLAAQGWAFATDDWERMRPLVSGAVHLCPGLFLAFAFSETRWRRWGPALAIVLALALLPIDQRSIDQRYAEVLLTAWNVGAWGAATALLVGSMRKHLRAPAPQRRATWVVVTLLVMVFPLGVGGGMVGGGFVTAYVMPLLMVWVQALVFVGVARLRFYDIEVRAARTGELAAGAAEQERLAVVGELAASLAHEIRNPLTGVRSLAQRLAEEEVEETKRRRYAAVILEEVGRVERLVANLLGIARRAPRRAASDAATPLASLFDDLALLLGSRAAKAGVRIVSDAGSVAAPAAREPLAQALLNLLLNALDHAPRGTAVDLSARETADSIEVIVRDHGPGVPATERERIWEPFHSGSGGTGLGLAVVRRLAREEGWTVDVSDAPGGGAEFRIAIPRRAPSSIEPDPKPLPAAARALLLVPVLISIVSDVSSAQTTDDAAVRAARAAAGSLFAAARVPGMQVAVAVDGRIVLSESFGYADFDRKAPVTADTRFEIGSVSKPLTAAAAMRLTERGALDLDAPVQRYVPSFPEKDQPITPRQLAGHLAGIRHYEPRDFAAGPSRDVADALRVFRDDPLVSAPGARHAYSSYGYILLSAAIESAAGRPFPEVMQGEVFAPLEMTATRGARHGETAAHYTAFDGSRATAAPPMDHTGRWAAGGFASTAKDLARFAAALMRPGYLRSESIETMFTPQTTAAGDSTGYGIGWRVGRDAAGRRIVHHGGRMPWMRAFLLLHPDQRVAVAVLANGPADFAENEAGAIAAPFLR
jgi:serine beta-lactamase-like protein LACTB, mitochondrial